MIGSKLFRKLQISFAVAAACCGSELPAADFLDIPNAAGIRYTIEGTKLNLRNLNAYDATWLGCCYNYYIDITTDAGKSMFSSLLSSILTGGRTLIGVNNKFLAGPVIVLGPA